MNFIEGFKINGKFCTLVHCVIFVLITVNETLMNLRKDKYFK